MNIITVTLLVIAIICIISMIVCHNSIKVTKYYIENRKVPERFNNFKIMHLSDFHSRSFENNNKLITKILIDNPDIIVMTGDMVNGKASDVQKIKKLIESIYNIGNRVIPIYYVMGNREFRFTKEEYVSFVNMLKDSNVIVLDNKKSEIKRKDESICIYGLNYENRIADDYYKYNHTNSKINEIKNDTLSVTPSIEKEKYSILLVHDPKKFYEYSNMGFDLVLSGHIHGGVVRIPIIDKGVLSPDFKFFPKFDKGIYKNNDSLLCVNVGIGYGTLPFRLFNKPEVVSIVLKNDSLHT